MKSVCVLLLVVSAVWAQTVHYDADQLRNYLLLSQQLRNEMYVLTSAFATRLAALETSVQAGRARVATCRSDLAHYLGTVNDVLGSLHADTNQVMGPVFAVQTKPTFSNVNDVLLNEVRLQHGIQYDTATGDASILQSGVYLLEFKLNGAAFRYVYFKMQVIKADGEIRYFFLLYIDWEVTGFFRTLKLEAGDTVDIMTFKSSGNSQVSYVRPGVYNVLAFRYLGQKPPASDLAETTQAPAPAETTAYWY